MAGHFDDTGHRILDQFKSYFRQLNSCLIDDDILGIAKVFEYYYRMTLALHENVGCRGICTKQGITNMMKFRKTLHPGYNGANVTSINQYMKTLANEMYSRFKPVQKCSPNHG